MSLEAFPQIQGVCKMDEKEIKSEVSGLGKMVVNLAGMFDNVLDENFKLNKRIERLEALTQSLSKNDETDSKLT